MKNKLNIFKTKKKKITYEDKPWVEFYPKAAHNPKFFTGTMYEALESTSKKHGNLFAYEYFNTKVTYADFIKKIHEAACALKSINVKIGDKVTICMPNTPEALIMFYACNKMGAIANMVHPLSSEKEIESYVSKADSEVILIADLFYKKVKAIEENTKLKNIIVAKISKSMDTVTKFGYALINIKKPKIVVSDKDLDWDDFIKKGKSFDGKFDYKPNENDVATFLYSGGTTGTSKAIMLTNKNFNYVAIQCMVMNKELAPGDIMMSALPIFHGFGLGVCIHAPFILGGRCLLIPSINAKKINSTIKKKKINILPGVPTLWEVLIKDRKVKANDLSSLKVVLSGGDYLSSELKNKTERFIKEHGSDLKIRIGYGLTEATAAVTCTIDKYYKKGSIGAPLPGNEFKVVIIGTEINAPIGKSGELCVNGPSLMKGYWKNEEETKNALRKHADGKVWLHTGDIVEMKKDGFFYYKTRLKRMIISSGYNVYPSYIEETLMMHPKLSACTVVGIPHKTKVQVAKAFIVLKDEFESSDELVEELKDFCKTRLARYSLPYEYEFVKVLPKTLMGKVAYRNLEDKDKQKD